MTYILVDTANTFFRARHVINGDADIKLGMAFHITLNSIKKAWQDFGGSHVVFCLEGRSWRKDHYKPYKAQRAASRAAHTEREAEEEKVFWEAFDTFKEFVTEKTNCTVLQNSRLEADDLIAGWIQSHPNDKHVIISTDTDFVQLNMDEWNVEIEKYWRDKFSEEIQSSIMHLEGDPVTDWFNQGMIHAARIVKYSRDY